MVQLNKLSFLFVAAVLFFGIPVTADAAGNHDAAGLNHDAGSPNHDAVVLNYDAGGLNHDADSRLAESDQQAAVDPAGTPELFGMHRHGTDAVDLVRALTLPNAKMSTDEEARTPGCSPKFRFAVRFRFTSAIHVRFIKACPLESCSSRFTIFCSPSSVQCSPYPIWQTRSPTRILPGNHAFCAARSMFTTHSKSHEDGNRPSHFTHCHHCIINLSGAHSLL
jgi:hypothetical protein